VSPAQAGIRFVQSRTIFVDTTGFSSTNFHLTNADKMTMFNNGVRATTEFLLSWNYEQWRAEYGARNPRPPANGPVTARA
jgi:hypothetical protein